MNQTHPATGGNFCPQCHRPDEPQRVQPSREDVARLAMKILGCEMDTDIPECPSCDGSVPCHHPEVGYCIVHDDLSADGIAAVGAPCPTAVRIADAVLALWPGRTEQDVLYAVAAYLRSNHWPEAGALVEAIADGEIGPIPVSEARHG